MDNNISPLEMGTYKVRNEIETKRNQQKRNEINEMKTKPTKSNARLLPTHVSSVFHQERTGFDHH